ncbi:hypothetical protein BASA83_003100 [Batrachochytrium salamandrivorans]|nr:hypothetical protein BASA83_003100 [Batrachochytrium salamandrivorans]
MTPSTLPAADGASSCNASMATTVPADADITTLGGAPHNGNDAGEVVAIADTTTAATVSHVHNTHMIAADQMDQIISPLTEFTAKAKELLWLKQHLATLRRKMDRMDVDKLSFGKTYSVLSKTTKQLIADTIIQKCTTELGLMEAFDIKADVLRRFLGVVRSKYNIISRSSGYNNSYQINAKTELAIVYNDNAPLEMHHAVAFACIKCADISNEVRPANVAEPWVNCLLEEFFSQSDREKAEGLPNAPFMDREKVTKPSAQIGFIAYVMIPMYELVGTVLPNMDQYIVQPIRESLTFYKDLLEKEKAEKEKAEKEKTEKK